MRRLNEVSVRLGKLAETAESTLEKSLSAETLERLQKEIDDRINGHLPIGVDAC